MTSVHDRISDVSSLERWFDLGVIGPQTQVFDLTDVSTLVDEMAAAARDARAPLMDAGQPPADECLFIVSGIALLCVKVEGGWRVGLGVNRELELARDEINAVLARAARAVSDPARAAQIRKDIPDFDARFAEAARFNNTSLVWAHVSQGGVASTDDDEVLYVSLVASAACEFMAMPIAAAEPVQIERAMRRRMERSRGAAVKLVAVKIKRGQHYSRPGDADEDAKHRPLHFCSGHWRRQAGSPNRRWIDGAWRIWIAGHWRGNPDVGVNLHRYIAMPKGMAA